MTTYSQCKERVVLPSWKLVTSFVLQWARFILRWTRLLYFRGCTLSYVGHVFCTSADARTNICTICTTSYVEHVFCTSVGAFHYTLDTSSVLRWAHYILRWTRILSASWPEEKRSAGAWRTGETHTHPKNVTFLGVSNIHLLTPTVVKQIFRRSEYNCSTKGRQDDCRHVSNARFWAEKNKTDL